MHEAVCSVPDLGSNREYACLGLEPIQTLKHQGSMMAD